MLEKYIQDNNINCLVKEKTAKLENKLVTLQIQDMRNFKHNLANVTRNLKRELNNMDQVMDIEKLNEFNSLKEEVGEAE